MSAMKNETCPKCGAAFDHSRLSEYTKEPVTRWVCGTWRQDTYDTFDEGDECLHRQLAQRDARIAALEAEDARSRKALEDEQSVY